MSTEPKTTRECILDLRAKLLEIGHYAYSVAKADPHAQKSVGLFDAAVNAHAAVLESLDYELGECCELDPAEIREYATGTLHCGTECDGPDGDTGADDDEADALLEYTQRVIEDLQAMGATNVKVNFEIEGDDR